MISNFLQNKDKEFLIARIEDLENLVTKLEVQLENSKNEVKSLKEKLKDSIECPCESHKTCESCIYD